MLQNPSFEAGLTGWYTNNVIYADNNPFEGTQAAELGQGVASMFQDVSLAETGQYPLLLSFNAANTSDNNSNGNLVAEVLWLDKDYNAIASGLRLFSPNGRINSRPWVTYYDITDQPPAGAAWARLFFSKGQGGFTDIIKIDQVLLTPVNTNNLVQNPSFELGLSGWSAAGFFPSFGNTFEGLAMAYTGFEGTIFQDIPISALPANSSFLLSFAARAEVVASLSIQVQWFDAEENEILPRGLDFIIPGETMITQINYLTYLDITKPAPTGAVKARILFKASLQSQNSFLSIDKVIFARTKTTNLVQNPSFKNGLDGWTPVNTTLVTQYFQSYEGIEVARVSEDGGALFQEVSIAHAAGHCFLFNCGLGYRRAGEPPSSGNMLVKVHWLDNGGREIGLGLCLVIPNFETSRNRWLVYTGITEPAPPGTAKARVQFTKTFGDTNGGTIDIDKVLLSRLV
ncbi:hypothetical protein ACOBQJ_14140 [Pelotomaculum propionicicum]|uniref:hypothetical protein n=1 Tax=Pelotomaculum propionicicum TaxID=258475 RepID=UPI003B7EE822